MNGLNIKFINEVAHMSNAWSFLAEMWSLAMLAYGGGKWGSRLGPHNLLDRPWYPICC